MASKCDRNDQNVHRSEAKSIYPTLIYIFSLFQVVLASSINAYIFYVLQGGHNNVIHNFCI